MPDFDDEDLENSNQENDLDADPAENDDDADLGLDDADSESGGNISDPAPAEENRSSPETEALMRRALEAETQLNMTRQERQRQADAERLANMTPEERTAHKIEELARNQQTFQNQMLFQQQDLADRSAFLSQVSSNPKLSKYSAEVEKELGVMRKNGQTAPREVILQWIIGRNAYKSLMGGQATKQKKQGQANVNNAKTKPITNKGNVVNIGKKAVGKYAHLENKFI